MNSVLLSVAIATKNREKYCIEAIKSILAYNCSELEITVADNSNTEEVKHFVEQLNHPTIKYKYDSGNVSSIENFNRAVELTTGQYIMLIGDDDTILPKAVEIAQWASKNDVDSICSKHSVTYYWPGALDEFPEGNMIIPASSGEMQKIDIRKNLEDLVKNGLQLYLLYPLPKTYHGIVKKSLMNEIKEKTGHYYGGLSPDLYSSIAVSCIAKNHYVIDEPLSVAGVCSVSTTADNFKGDHSGTLENIPHLKHRPNYEFSSLIPLYYSVNTIWAESGLKALEELHENELLKKFNMFHLMAQAWIHNKKFIPELIRTEHRNLIRKHKINPVIYHIQKNKAAAKIFFSKIRRTINERGTKNETLEVKGLFNLTQVIDKYKSLEN